MIKTLVLVMAAGLLGGTGHVMLSKGMRTVGDLTEAPAAALATMALRAVSNPWVLLGVALQASFFFLYLTLLSRADVSKVLPMTAFDYIVVALLAQALLAEPVTASRWAGIGLIVAGVALVSRS
ncbi:MAG TPA: EamA family transporter [Candidatus Tectomicrobia bacterium]|nr:EamA family transporter [Candidatus Tectomicrobia bacterium]